MKKITSLLALFLSFLIVMLPVCFSDAISYDANGNIVHTESDNLFRVYNSENKLAQIFNGTNATDGILLQEYTYDLVSERVLMKKTYNGSGEWVETTIYVDKNHVVVKNASGSFDYLYVYHEGNLVAQVNPDNTTYYVLGDHLGSSSVITNSSGEEVERNSYTPYGMKLDGGDTVDRLYEGKEYDSVVGDYDFHFRKYGGAELPIFMQPDSLLPNVYDPQQLNRYMFERGNPWKYVDVDGHAILMTLFIIGAAVVTLVSLSMAIYDVYKNPQNFERRSQDTAVTAVGAAVSIFLPPAGFVLALFGLTWTGLRIIQDRVDPVEPEEESQEQTVPTEVKPDDKTQEMNLPINSITQTTNNIFGIYYSLISRGWTYVPANEEAGDYYCVGTGCPGNNGGNDDDNNVPDNEEPDDDN